MRSSLGIMLLALLGLQAMAQVSPLPEVTVKGHPQSEDLIGPYEQPRWTARGRFTSNTDVYVLPPWAFFVDLDYSLTIPKHGGDKTHLFTQEFELGLPWRTMLAYENSYEVTKLKSQITEQTIEARLALADWGKIPLNPTLFAEYHFGVGKEYEEDEEEDEIESSDIPDAVEVRLLLAEQIAPRLQWALNLFHEWETAGEREQESGFDQSFSYAIRDEWLRAGIEMQFIRATKAGERSEPEWEFDIGPSITVKPCSATRLDVATLFGTTDDSPAASIYAILSIAFGKGEDEDDAARPVSTRHR